MSATNRAATLEPPDWHWQLPLLCGERVRLRELRPSDAPSLLEILTADQDLFEQQILLAETQGAELRARAELYRTLGGGWQP